MSDITSVMEMTVPLLKNELRRRGLRISGRKAELQGRLFQAICDDDPAMRAAAHSAVRAPPVPIASSAHAAATIHNGTAALAAASAAAAAVATSTASQKRGRERALSLDDLERVMGVTGPATATGSVATAGGATESYITPVFTPRAAQVGRPSAPAMSRPFLSGTGGGPTDASSNLYIWEWERQPGLHPIHWQPFDARMCQELSAKKKLQQQGRSVQPAYVHLKLTPADAADPEPITYIIDLISLTFRNMKTGESRRIRFKQPSPGENEITLVLCSVPQEYISTVYQLQFLGFPAQIALEVLQEPGISPQSMPDLVSRLHRKIEEREAAAMNAAMDASRNEYEEEQARNRAESKRRRLDLPPMQNPAFNQSVLLSECRTQPVFASWANQDDIREPLVRLLELEGQCAKWYPTSTEYFKGVGSEFATLSVQPNPHPLLEDQVRKQLQYISDAITKFPESSLPGSIPKLFLPKGNAVDTDDGVKLVAIDSSPSGENSQDLIVVD